MEPTEEFYDDLQEKLMDATSQLLNVEGELSNLDKIAKSQGIVSQYITEVRFLNDMLFKMATHMNYIAQIMDPDDFSQLDLPNEE